MTEPGLNSRLRQRSRRAGIMIGISMALTIAVCVGSFSVIYASLNGVVSDFVTQGEVEDRPVATVAPAVAEADVAEAQPTSEAPEPTTPPESAEAAATEDATEPASTEEAEQTETPEDDGEFTPDYAIDSAPSVNLRAGPSVQQSESLGALNFGTQLEYLNESQPTDDPAGDNIAEGDLWLQFRTEDGREGWVREIDVVEIAE